MKFFLLILLTIIAGMIIRIVSCTKVYHTDEVCFQENILPIFVSNCAYTDCHNSIDRKEEYDLTSYSGIMRGVVPKHPALSEVYKVVKGKHPSMPPSPYQQLTAEQLNQIKLWILIGAPNSSNCVTCDSVDYTYSGRIQSILNSWCTGCHNASINDGGIDLTHYTGTLITVQDGTLQGSIHHQAGFTPMPKNAGLMSQCDMDAIDRWIADGYLNN